MPSTDKQLIRSCPVCSGTQKKDFLQKQQMLLVECHHCGMIFADRVPAQYSAAFYNEIADSLYLSEEKLRSDYASVRFEREIALLRRYVTGGNVLDVGCSTGAFLYQLKTRWSRDYNVLGTDVCKPALAYARKQKVNVVEESFLHCDLKPGRFDAITFWAVLEHLLEPGTFVAKAGELLKPGGFCFILVPNFRSLATRMLGARYRYIFPQHVNYFTMATLHKLISVTDQWDIIGKGTCHFNPLVILQDRKNTEENFISDQDRVGLLKATTSYKQNPLLAPLKLAYKLSEKCLGAAELADNLYLVLQKRNP